MKYWELIADNLSKAGRRWGCVSAIDSNGRTIWIADAHRGDGKRFVSDAEEKLRAFLELESAIRAGEVANEGPVRIFFKAAIPLLPTREKEPKLLPVLTT